MIKFESTQIGYSEKKTLLFGFYEILWWGDSDPVRNGYKKVFGNIYRKDKNALGGSMKTNDYDKPGRLYGKCEFCKSVVCKYYRNGKCQTLMYNCCYTAKSFHQWLNDNGFEIVKRQDR